MSKQLLSTTELIIIRTISAVLLAALAVQLFIRIISL
jgi:small neutral amino acid transporter SnatA (MarC family)